MPKHHLTATGIQGLCAPTNYDESGQCHSGPSGAFKLSTLKACERRCAQCSACNFISFSASQNDCSWYSECDLERVSTGGGAAVSSAMIASYQTYDMANLREQRRAALLAQSPRRPIVAPDFSSLEAACGPGYASSGFVFVGGCLSWSCHRLAEAWWRRTEAGRGLPERWGACMV